MDKRSIQMPQMCLYVYGNGDLTKLGWMWCDVNSPEVSQWMWCESRMGFSTHQRNQHFYKVNSSQCHNVSKICWSQSAMLMWKQLSLAEWIWWNTPERKLLDFLNLEPKFSEYNQSVLENKTGGKEEKEWKEGRKEGWVKKEKKSGR